MFFKLLRLPLPLQWPIAAAAQTATGVVAQRKESQQPGSGWVAGVDAATKTVTGGAGYEQGSVPVQMLLLLTTR